MLRYLLGLCLSIIFSSLYAQSAISYGLQFAPGYSFRKSLPLNDTTIDDLIELDEFESGEFAYSAGVRVEMKLGDKVGFQTGANFVRLGYRTGRTRVVSQIEGTETVLEREQQFAFSNIEVPFILNFYQEISPQSRVYFKMGGSALYNLNRNARTLQYTEEALTGDQTQPITNGADVNVSVQTGAGYEHRLNKIALFVEPVFQYYLRSQHSDFNFARQPYFLGVTVGVKIK